MADTPTDLLIVDDNPDDCFRYQRLLERAHPGSYGIRVTGSGREGLRACRERCPTALLLDYLLPDMDGIEFLENLRDPSLLRESIEPLVIVSTGQGSEEIAVRCLKLGAYDYLVKENLTGQELHRTIRAGLIQRDLERRLREKQDELESFAFVAAHDLRAPLQKISSFCEILEMRSDGADPETADILTRIVRSTTRMRRLVDDLLAYARVGRFSVQSSVHLDEVASTALSNLEELIRRSSANVQIDPLPEVEGDAAALVTLLQNLIGNAVKFQPASQAPFVRVTCEEDGDQWVFSVLDNGIGIAPKDRERVFAPLERAQSQDVYEGSGIGLAACRRVIEHHRGRIWIAEPDGPGTRIRFTLPRRQEQVDDAPEALAA